MDICGIWWNIMELLRILHSLNEICGNISIGHTAIFWHNPQHSMDFEPKIPYFIYFLWKSVEYGGISWNFLSILHPENETCKNILLVGHLPQYSCIFHNSQWILNTKFPIYKGPGTLTIPKCLLAMDFVCMMNNGPHPFQCILS